MQYTVKPGQSLADVATAATQSRDKTVLGRAAKAIFDANPSAFMRGDPSLLKLGAVLNVPLLDATGAAVKAETPPAGLAVPSAASAGAAASQTAGAAAAKAGSAQAAAPASSPAAAASQAPASAAVSAQTTAATPAATPAPASNAAAPAAASHPQAAAPGGASGAHAWAGAIQAAPAASASAGVEAGASAAGVSQASAASAPAASAGETASSGAATATAASTTGASAPAAAMPASPVAASAAAGAPAKVSSLQQLLTLKNRVLMELQRHGFGTPSAQRSGAAANAPAGASGFTAAPPASGAAVATVPGRSRTAAAANQRFIGIDGVGVNVARADVPALAAVVAAVVAALLVVLVALGLSRRKRRPPIPAARVPGGAPSADTADRANEAAQSAAPRATPDDPVATEFLAILARNPASKRALMGLAAHYAERGNVPGFDEIAQRIYRLSGGRGPNWVHVASIGRQLDPNNPLFALAAGETDEAVLTGAPEAEPSNEAPVSKPQADLAAPSSAESAPEAHPIGEPPIARASTEPAPSLADVPPAIEAVSQAEPAEAPHAAVPPEPEHVPAAESDWGKAAAPAAPEAGMPSEPEPAAVPHVEATLPPEAMAALHDLDFGLPPRAESEVDGLADRARVQADEPEHQAFEEPAEPTKAEAREHTRDGGDAKAGPGHGIGLEPGAQPEAEAAREFEPGAARPAPAVPPSVAGLGAAPIGPLDLSFDLDLPGVDAGERNGSMAASAPLPQFTPEQLVKIARNKLDLAAEYIALGDLGGARTLIHEVIESNDAATLDEAHAMLATLAPLS